MNTLRVVSAGGGALVVAAALWAALRYGDPSRFLPGAAVGVVVAVAPRGIARVRHHARSLRERRGEDGPRHGPERGAIFVSETKVEDPLDRLEAIVPAVRADGSYDEVARERFEEGPGLSVVYGGFHNSFVRVSEAGRVVVTGASERTTELVETVSDAADLSFRRRRTSPFAGPDPVRGAPRVFLGAALVGLTVVGLVVVAGGAYPSPAYNPAERTVMAGIDARGDLDPRISRTDSRLSRAAFLAAVVDEESLEIRWVGNDSERVRRHGEQALTAARDARALLASTRAAGLTSAQRERADGIERRLAAAQRSVAAALATKTERTPTERTDGIVAVGDRLRTAANATAATG